MSTPKVITNTPRILPYPPTRPSEVLARSGHCTSRLVAHEGSRVSVTLADGSRIDDCELVSVGRGRAGTIWIFTGAGDVFIPIAEVIDLWPVPPVVTRPAGGVPGRPAADGHLPVPSARSAPDG